MDFIFSCLIGYILGSVPTAYLLTKYFKGMNILEEGSGNAGAMNSYRVSSSKSLALAVLSIDLLKGFLTVLIVQLIYPEIFVYPALSLIFAILAHTFNPWLKFKGGRGLAAAGGGTIYLFPIIPVVWLVFWIAIYIFKRNIYWANISAIILTFLTILYSSNIAVKYTFPSAGSEDSLVLFSVSLLILLFIRHTEPLLNLLQNKKWI